MSSHLQARIARTQELLQSKSVDAVIATSMANVYYYTGQFINGHERLIAVVIPAKGDAIAVVPEMHRLDFQGSEIDTVFWEDGADAVELVAKALPGKGTVSVDDLWPSINLLGLIGHRPGLSFVNSVQTLSLLRRIKDAVEVDILRQAGHSADEVMHAVIPQVRAGMREVDVADLLYAAWKKTSMVATPPIVGTGKNGALPHHHTDDTIIKEGDMVVIDMGCIHQQYYSDMTRTTVVGEPTAKQREVYDVVKAAHLAAADFARPGVALEDVDKRAREVIEKAGYGKYFTHRTGHGLGIEIHEEPYVCAGNRLALEPGMVITIEPGIYLPEEFGVRIEDTVVITENGCESLEPSNKDLIVTGR